MEQANPAMNNFGPSYVPVPASNQPPSLGNEQVQLPEIAEQYELSYIPYKQQTPEQCRQLALPEIQAQVANAKNFYALNPSLNTTIQKQENAEQRNAEQSSYIPELLPEMQASGAPDGKMKPIEEKNLNCGEGARQSREVKEHYHQFKEHKAKLHVQKPLKVLAKLDPEAGVAEEQLAAPESAVAQSANQELQKSEAGPAQDQQELAK